MVNNRYHLHEKLGQGSMGFVYRATDRLTGQVVALKQLAPFYAATPQTEIEKDFHLTLTREFQILSSLRHPHIISVLDFGFDHEKRPFFTMNYLSAAQTILEAGHLTTPTEKVQLLQQVLLALTYLHRRHILHRDIKPSNILVTDGVLRLLDFGVAAPLAQAYGMTGTLAYLAPELLQNTPATAAADLYAVGLIAYELFAGQHPFNLNSQHFVKDILTLQPDLQQINAPPPLQIVIGRLLAKKPTHRYATAEQAMNALSQAINLPIPPESIAIRESYLQAAQFVGREQELTQLKEALISAQTGQGTTWLIGGESGIGKSRLLQELRIHALVSGFLVLEGQAVKEGGGIPFQLWREPLRRLLLNSQLNSLDASVLRPLIPDIERLLGHPIPSALPLSGPDGQQRLLSVIGRLITAHPQPILLLLEDLQWCWESLLVLQHVNQFVPQHPLLIIATYREDEKPDLPQTLPHMTLMKLGRLSATDIHELSQSMSGLTTLPTHLTTYLEQQTEGNAFFLVEIMRVLAQQAGRLNQVSNMPLPDSLFPAGIQSILQRRLAQVPAPAHPLLQIAAIAGRQLDLRLLKHLASPKIGLTSWLTICAEAVVLEIDRGHWRFSHDKLRDAILAELPPKQQKKQYTSVATALEHLYPGDLDQASRLSYLWRKIGNPDKELYYTRIAGEYALTQYAHDAALIHLNRALELTTERSQQYQLLLKREKALGEQGQRTRQAQDLETLHNLVMASGDPCRQTAVQIRFARYGIETSNYKDAVTAARQATQYALACGSYASVYQSKLILSEALTTIGEYQEARINLEEELPLLRQANAGNNSPTYSGR